jgi:guanylate kinase
MSSERGRLIVISGPTASGKSTLWRRLVHDHGVEFSVSATTRPMRAGEQDGRDYRFLDDAEFARLVAEDAFLEHAEVHGRHYGTLRAPVEKAIAEGRDILLEIDVQGARQLQGCGLPMVSVFVEPPSMAVLEQRLRTRGTEDETEMRRRLAVVEAEMRNATQYDFRVINDDLERMVAEVEGILGYVRTP